MKSTLDSLHRAAQLLSVIRKSRIEPQPNALHLSLYVTRTGLTTGLLDTGECFDLHFGEAIIEPRQHGKDAPERIAFDGKTSAEVLTALGANDLQQPNDTTPFVVVREDAESYAHLLYTIYTAMSRFRARLGGAMTPLVVWSHHFDLSFLWFRGNVPDEHTAPHINFGFAPFSPSFDQPYVYVYAWSQLGYLTIDPPYPAQTHTETFTGIVLDYPTLQRYVDRDVMLERVLDNIYRQFAPFL